MDKQFEQMSLAEWGEYVQQIINTSLQKFGGHLDKRHLDIPLTDAKIGFSANDIYELYKCLERLTDREIVLSHYNDFESISSIAKTMFEQFNCIQ